MKSFKHQFNERCVCPACGSSVPIEIFNARFDSSPILNYIENYYGANKISELSECVYQLDKCQKCKLVYQRYIGDEVFLSELYGNWLSTTENQSSAEIAFAQFLMKPRATRDGHELMWASKYLGKSLFSMRTFDYGMGWALWARIAKDIGCESYGFDLSTQRMDAACQQGVRVLEADNFPLDSFDFINTDQVFEHVPDPLALAEKLSTLLRPGGILKISVPNGSDIIKRLKIGNWDATKGTKESLNAIAPLEHINCFNAKTLITMAIAAKLMPISVNMFQQFSFIFHKNSINLTKPKETMKAFIRPWYRFHNRQSLYIWLQRAI